jgi:hypothetical protein
MKLLGNSLAAVVVAILAIAIAAPAVISLSHALVPLVVVVSLALIAVRYVFFHTRRW